MQNQIPKNWQKVKLGNIGKVITGNTPPTPQKDLFGLDYPFITPTDIKDYDVRYNYLTERFVSEKWMVRKKNLSLPKNSTCFVCIGSTIGKMCLVKETSFTNQQINTIISDPAKSDPLFIYYLLKNNQKNILKEFGGGGAAKPIINKSIFEGIEVEFPEDILEQGKIASILSAFDDKIELNNKIAKDLEEMAQALFKEWFVNFRFPGYEKAEFVDSKLGKIPKGWGVKSGDEIILRLPQGRTYKVDEIQKKGSIPIYDQSSDAILDFHDDKPAFVPTLESPVAIFGDHTCRMKILINPFSLGPNVVPFIGNNGYPTLFIYYLTKNQVKQMEYKRHWTELTSKNYIIPSINLANEFSERISVFIKKIEHIGLENQKLAALRDLLLPKLMKGEIRV